MASRAAQPPGELLDLYRHLHGEEAFSHEGELYPARSTAGVPFAQPGRTSWAGDGLRAAPH